MDTLKIPGDYFTNMNLEAACGTAGYNVAVNPY